MTTSSHTLAYTRTHTATQLTGVIFGTIGDILADLGISHSGFSRNWEQNESAIQAWITEGSLEQVVLECHQPSGAVDPVIEFPVVYTPAGTGDVEFTASRARLARFLAKLDLVPAGTTCQLFCTFSRSHTPQPGWGPGTRASTDGLRGITFGTLGRAHMARPGCATCTAKDATMGYIDDAFGNLKHNLEINRTEQDTAVRRHHSIRDYVRSRWDLEDDFLTGSYRRDTKTKKLKDIDIFIVIDKDEAEADYRAQPPGEVLGALEDLLRDRWPDARRDGMAVVIHYGKDDDIMSIDVVPAFDRKGGGYLIPNADAGDWIATNPKRHHELSIAKNAECDGKFVRFVKMIKGINRELREPVSPSFLLEVMAQALVKTPFGRYQDEIALFLATAAEQIDQEWPDPAGLGGDVNTVMSYGQKLTATIALRSAQETAERAIGLEDDVQERAAYDEWKKLFGNRMTRP